MLKNILFPIPDRTTIPSTTLDKLLRPKTTTVTATTKVPTDHTKNYSLDKYLTTLVQKNIIPRASILYQI